jgi:hypothetical protein
MRHDSTCAEDLLSGVCERGGEPISLTILSWCKRVCISAGVMPARRLTARAVRAFCSASSLAPSPGFQPAVSSARSKAISRPDGYASSQRRHEDRLADATKAKIRNLMIVLFNHAIRYEWLEQRRNPITLVRQSAQRRETYWEYMRIDPIDRHSGSARVFRICLLDFLGQGT